MLRTAINLNNMKKIIAFLMIFAFAWSMLPAAPAQAAYSEGWVDSIAHGLSGWAYDSNKPVKIFIYYDEVNTGQDFVVEVDSSPVQTSAWLWSKRPDVESYLMSKGESVTANTGYLVEHFRLLPNGTWRITGATFNGMPMKINQQAMTPFTVQNTPQVPNQPATYVNGWIDTVNSGLRGWAYDNDTQLNIQVTYENVGNPSLIHTENISSTPTQTAKYIFLHRNDITMHLAARGVSSNVPTGFLLDHAKFLPVGTWRLKSATFNGKAFRINPAALNLIQIDTAWQS
jgi:hypothetical protein